MALRVRTNLYTGLVGAAVLYCAGVAGTAWCWRTAGIDGIGAVRAAIRTRRKV
jgi:hypothetical protein